MSNIPQPYQTNKKINPDVLNKHRVIFYSIHKSNHSSLKNKI